MLCEPAVRFHSFSQQLEFSDEDYSVSMKCISTKTSDGPNPYSVLLGWLTSSYLDYGNHEPEIYVQSIPKSVIKMHGDTFIRDISHICEKLKHMDHVRLCCNLKHIRSSDRHMLKTLCQWIHIAQLELKLSEDHKD
uniref:Uncharacterized protein n=1 Tax=viral metagenome TaxID=1070528 RepID=A0A6C0F4R2_9ZZZZ|tara:strand:+ start:643 stop:1050 length:408 start_codon:yes stop_codon:yes gene_type:complete